MTEQAELAYAYKFLLTTFNNQFQKSRLGYIHNKIAAGGVPEGIDSASLKDHDLSLLKADSKLYASKHRSSSSSHTAISLAALLLAAVVNSATALCRWSTTLSV
jgi:hypothetical protein